MNFKKLTDSGLQLLLLLPWAMTMSLSASEKKDSCMELGQKDRQRRRSLVEPRSLAVTQTKQTIQKGELNWDIEVPTDNTPAPAHSDTSINNQSTANTGRQACDFLHYAGKQWFVPQAVLAQFKMRDSFGAPTLFSQTVHNEIAEIEEKIRQEDRDIPDSSQEQVVERRLTRSNSMVQHESSLVKKERLKKNVRDITVPIDNAFLPDEHNLNAFPPVLLQKLVNLTLKEPLTTPAGQTALQKMICSMKAVVRKHMKEQDGIDLEKLVFDLVKIAVGAKDPNSVENPRDLFCIIKMADLLNNKKVVNQCAPALMDMLTKDNPLKDLSMRTLEGHENTIRGITSFQRNGSQHFVSASFDGTLRVWDQRMQMKEFSATPKSSIQRGVVYIPHSNTLVSAGSDNRLRVFDYDSGNLVRTLEGPDGHTEPVWCVAHIPQDNRVASGSFDGTVKIWDPSTGGLIGTLRRQTPTGEAVDDGGIISVFHIPDTNCIASGSNNGIISIWDCATRTLVRTLVDPALAGTNKGHNTTVTSLTCASTKEGKRVLVSGAWDRTIKVWDLRDGTLLRTLNNMGNGVDKVMGLTYIPEMDLLVAGSDDQKTIKTWDFSTGRLVRTLAGHDAPVWCLHRIPKTNCIVSGSKDKKMKLWNLVPFSDVTSFAQLELCYQMLTNNKQLEECERDFNQLPQGLREHLAGLKLVKEVEEQPAQPLQQSGQPQQTGPQPAQQIQQPFWKRWLGWQK